MAFSIKNIFHKGGGTDSHPGTAPDGSGFFGGNGAAVSGSPFGMAAAAGGDAAPQGHAGGFAPSAQAQGFGGTLFRTVGSENLDGAPVTPGNGGSPFAPYASPERTTLTAGDFLPHLPADVARANGVMPDQPVAVSPQALEAAISSGQLAVPLFEIYHVCPALFRVPVSPHDTRMVPLPKSKLPSMIASHTSALKPPSGPAQMQPGSSPFGAAAIQQVPQQPPNPFAPALPELPTSGPMAGAGTRPAGTLPPRRPPGTAPAIPTQADFVGQNSLSLPGQPPAFEAQAAQQAPRSLFQPVMMGGEPPAAPAAGPVASPFAAMPAQAPQQGAPFQAATGATSLLFGIGKPPSDPELGGSGGTGPLPQGNGAPPEPPASPFGAMPMQGGSPFGAAPEPQASPFGAMPTQGGSPFGAAQGGPPPGSLFQIDAGGGPPPSPFSTPPPVQVGSPFGAGPGGLTQGSPFQPGAMDSGNASPFASIPGGGSPFAAPTQAPSAAPFQPPMGGANGDSPFHPATSAAPMMPVQPLPFTPFGPPPGSGDSGSPFASHQGPMGQEPAGQPSPFGGSPFAPQGTMAHEPGGQSSPFAGTPPQVASFEVPPRHVTPEPPKLGNLPFSAQQSRQTIKVQPGPSPSYGTPPMPPSSGGGDETMEVSLAAVLKGQAAHDLGFDPNFIPGWITTKLPAAEVREQLGSGQVALNLGMIIDGTDHSFRSVISHGRRDFTVRVAASEVFHTMAPASSTPSLTPTPPVAAAPQPGQMPPQAPFQPPASPFGGGPAPFQPLSMPAFPPMGSNEPPAPPPNSGVPVGSLFQPTAFPSMQPAAPPSFPAFPSTPPEPAAKAFDPFAAAEGEWGGKAGSPLFAPAPEINKPEGLSSEQLFAEKSASPATGPQFSPAPEKAPAPMSFFADVPPAKPDSATEPNQGGDFRDVNRAPSGPMVRAAVESIFQPAPVAPTPAVPAARPVAHAATAMAGLSLTAAGDNDQLMIRALLGVSEKLNRQAVLEHIAKLPGVAACAWVRGGKIVAEGDGSKAAQDFRQQATDIATSMRTLARLTGLEAETLSIAVGDRLLTFCLQQDQSLGVLHTSMEPPSGLREKITLLSRELAQMSGD